MAAGLGLALVLTGVAMPVLAMECVGTGATELVENVDFCVDSVLSSQSGNRYGPANLFDGDRGTAWCEGVSGNGIGQTITIYITNGVPFDRLLMWNGYQKNGTTFTRNARPKKIAVKSQIEPKRTFTLPDTTKQLNLKLKTMTERSKIVIEILEVYPGTHYQDTCISGLFVDLESGRKAEYQSQMSSGSNASSGPGASQPPVGAGDAPPPVMRDVPDLPEMPGL